MERARLQVAEGGQEREHVRTSSYIDRSRKEGTTQRMCARRSAGSCSMSAYAALPVPCPGSWGGLPTSGSGSQDLLPPSLPQVPASGFGAAAPAGSFHISPQDGPNFTPAATNRIRTGRPRPRVPATGPVGEGRRRALPDLVRRRRERPDVKPPSPENEKTERRG
jgi:hypothetical protein